MSSLTPDEKERLVAFIQNLRNTPPVVRVSSLKPELFESVLVGELLNALSLPSEREPIMGGMTTTPGARPPYDRNAYAAPQPRKRDGAIDAGSGNGADRKSDLPPPAVAAQFWVQYSHLADGGFGRVMWESDFQDFCKDHLK